MHAISERGDHPTRPHPSPRVEWIAAGLTLAIGLGITLGMVVGRGRTGLAAILVGKDRGLVPDATAKSLGDVEPDATVTVTFTLRNPTDRPIRIQGAQTSCVCTVVEGIPCLIPAGDEREIQGVVHASREPGRFDGRFVLYTDDDIRPEVQLDYRGQVVAPSREGPPVGP